MLPFNESKYQEGLQKLNDGIVAYDNSKFQDALHCLEEAYKLQEERWKINPGAAKEFGYSIRSNLHLFKKMLSITAYERIQSVPPHHLNHQMFKDLFDSQQVTLNRII